MYCHKCGKENQDNVTFCINCGEMLNPIEDLEDTSVLKPNDNFSHNQYTYQNNIQQNAKPTKKKLSKGAIAGIIVAVIIIIIVVMIAILSKTSNSSEYDYDYATDNIGTSDLSLDYDTGYSLSDDIFDYQIKVGDIVYQFPMTVQEFMDTGLSYSQYENPNDKISSGYSGIVNFVYSDGSLVNAKLVNFTKSETEYANCHVVGMTVNATTGDLIFDASNVSIAKGITLGVSTRDDVERLLGEPNDIVEVEEYSTVTLEYSQDIYKSIRLGFDANNILNSIDIENISKPENVVEVGVSDSIPQLVKDYVQPKALGNDITSGNFELEGVLYKLPVPLNELIKNGWSITEQDDETISGKSHTCVSLQNGNIQIENIFVHNYEEYEVSVENGIITEFGSSKLTYESVNSLNTPNQISVGMSLNEFEKAIKNSEYETKETDFDTRYYFKDNEVELNVYVENNKVEIIAIYWKGN